MKKPILNEEISRIKKMMKSINEHEFDFEAPQEITGKSYHGKPIKVVKSYETIGKLKMDFNNLETITNDKGIVGSALSTIDFMKRGDSLPIHLIRKPDGEFNFCFDNDLQNINDDQYLDDEPNEFSDEDENEF